jgi:glycosyltransferase involved in cell wall biosynthesis
MARLRVALNGRFSGTLQPTGMQVTAFHLLDAIVRTVRDFDVVIFADPQFPGVGEWASFSDVELVPTPFVKWSRMKSQLWEQLALPWLVKSKDCRIVHHPITTCPRFNLGTKTVVTLHDLGFLHHPEWVDASFRRWLLATAIPGIRAATRVVAISDYVLADIRRSLGLSEEKTLRIYNGINPTPEGGAPKNGSVPFRLLGVNLWQPHKNLIRLIDAFALLRVRYPQVELHLAGRPQARYREQPELAQRLETPGVKILGYLSNAELADAYRAASVFVFPSLEEGFGLPILEAMSAGTPVVTSNASCLPEIAGGAAILVDPLRIDAIAEGLESALTESLEAREARIAQGFVVARRFSWFGTAQAYTQLYRTLA